jgi:hypothetical protein
MLLGEGSTINKVWSHSEDGDQSKKFQSFKRAQIAFQFGGMTSESLEEDLITYALKLMIRALRIMFAQF